MLFIQQQIQSFLNLGGCKEYFIMAKPKLPKNPNNLKPTIPAVITPAFEPQISHPIAPVETSPAASATEIKATETRATESKITEPRKVVRKPEIVKSEPRANLVPINLEEEIRRFAYLLAERRGFQPGHEAEDWLSAENEIRQRYHQHSA
jgi:hypothetical protein